MSADLTIRGRSVVLPSGVASASIHVKNGIIVAVEAYDSVPAGVEIMEAGPLLVMPGVVDSHVHLNDPGRTHWEGFLTGTRAAAVGGVTTLVDMPLNSIPATTTLKGLQAKLKAAEGACSVDVGFWGGVVPGNTPHIEPLLGAGVLGFKCFLVPSGVEEFEAVSERDLREALPVLAANDSVLLVHAEMPGPIETAQPTGSPRTYSTYLASRPPEAETEAVEMLISLSREFGARTHIVHLSAAKALPMLYHARRTLPITVETCPHYLCFQAGQVPEGATEFKCAPPIRNDANREQLWKALKDGVIDLIATDHSPCPPEMKGLQAGDFFKAWGGIASLQFGLAAVWTEAEKRGIGIAQVSSWMSAGPARLAGLAGRKGIIAPGADADLIFFDPERKVDWTRPIEHRHKLTPYREAPLRGVVERTILRGQTIYSNGELSRRPHGRVLRSTLYDLNHLTVDASRARLQRCCGSSQWASAVTQQRPFQKLNDLLQAADEVAAQLADEDWLEAFAAHPQIGAKNGSNWSKQEQSKVAGAAEETREELARLNQEYFDRFEFIFIICATGKTAEEILGQLRGRLGNTREAELARAAAEQRQITALRLRKLVGL